MIIDRKLGDRLQIDLLPVGRQRSQTHILLESNLSVAWKRVISINDPRLVDPRFTAEGDKWAAFSRLTGERLANICLIPPPKGRRSP